ncbi:hypothetical protein KO317_04360, partial [Candidatus Micrarchaeota archaeon]|nr:hypothetical protein [Candidatus Micrarchaeota archaeon]
ILQEGYETEGICETGTLCDLDAIYPGNNIECTIITCEAIAFDGEYSDTGLSNWENECPEFCEDSDGGPILTIFGITTNRLGSYEDYCVDETKITEHYCDGTELITFETSCPFGTFCNNGVCINNPSSLTIDLISPENDITINVNEGGAIPLIWRGESEFSDTIQYTVYLSCETNIHGGKSYSPIYSGYSTLFLFNGFEECEEYMYWYVVANDGYNTQVSEEWRFKVDTNYPPTIELISPENELGVCGNSIEFTWEGNDLNEDTLIYTLHILQGGEEITTHTTEEESYSIDLEQGEYEWYVSVTDGEFNTHSEHWNIGVYSTPNIILISPPEYSWVSNGDIIYFEINNFDYRDWGWDVTELTRDSKDSRSEEFEPIVPYWLDYGEHNITIRLDNGICELQETFIFNVAECWEDIECEHLDYTYCSGDLIITREGVCNSEHKCISQNAGLEDCNRLNNYFCDGSLIMYEDYTCSEEIETQCVINRVYEEDNCDDGLFCNGNEMCSILTGGEPSCLSGTPVDCSGNNLLSIETCNNNPDANPFTWDFFAGFTSTCNEETESCTLGTVDLTHECSVTDCDAECDAENDCEDTDCEDLSGCYAGKYRTYSNVPNTCLDDCVCTENECSMDFEYTLTGTDADGDGWDLECGDCDDSNPNVHPDAEEICNGIDDNCNGEIDEDLPIYTYYRDSDGDGYGDPTNTFETCTDYPAEGYVEDNTDCNDLNYFVNPEMEEICNGIDDNCDMIVDEITEECGEGICAGEKLCIVGHWSDCSSDGQDAGICALCDADGYVIYDETQNTDCNEGVECAIGNCYAIFECTYEPDHSYCDNGIYCDGTEYCNLDFGCQEGVPVDCSGNNLAGIATCTNDPDANPFTWDFFGGFTSTCNEDVRACTIGTIELTHECSVESCDAECDAENDCEDTDCSALSGCVGLDYYEYSNVPNTCLDDCLCTDNECSIYEIYENDYRCTNCHECEHLQLYIPNGIEREEYHFGGYTIIVDEITEEKIYFHYSYLGEYLYRGSVSIGKQIVDTPHNPVAPSLLTKVCDVREVETENEWGCFGFNLIGETTCESDSDCSSLNTIYCTGDLIMQTEGICEENICVAETIELENCNTYNTESCDGTNRIYSDYSCSAGECIAYDSTIIEECDNEIYCDGQETCTELLDGITECQAGTPVDCSGNNLLSIETCNNNPDANPFTWDFFGGFTSTCNEETESCTLGTVDLTHECSVTDCDAECDAENDCEDTDCSALSGCVGLDYYEYSNVPNDCLGDCTCTDNECSVYEVFGDDLRCELRECVEPYAGMIIMEDTIFCEGEYEVFGNITIGADNIVIEGNNTVIIGNIWYEEDTRNSEEQQETYSIKKTEYRDEGNYLNGITIKNIKFINYGIGTSFFNNSKIQNNTFEGFSSIYGTYTLNSEIIDNTIRTEGIYFLIAPLDFMNSDNLTIERNIIENDEETLLSMGSLLLLNTHNSKITDNTIVCEETMGDGIYILGNNNEIISNSVTTCYRGLFSNGAYYNIIEDNYLCRNEIDILLDTSTGNNIGDNICDEVIDLSIYPSNSVTCSIDCVLNLLTGECIDSDEGYNIFNYGETTYLGESKKDNCRDELSLYEYFCDINGVMRSSIEYCPFGYVCLDGECKSLLTIDKYIQTKDGIEKIYEGYNKPDTNSIKPPTTSVNKESSSKDFKP